MTPIRRILVPIDFSEPSRQALDHAAELGKVFNAELRLLHIQEGQGYAFLDPAHALARLAPGLNEHLGKKLQKLATEVSQSSGLVVKSKVLEEHTATGITEYAARMKADLIVIATHGRTGIARALIGSVAEKIIRTSDVPVLTYRIKEPDRAPGAL